LLLTAGSRVERYQVEALVSDAGNAEVYRVRHAWLGSLHALKLINLTANQALRTALLVEGRAMAVMNHPNLVRVTDALPVEDLPALIMDWVEGPSLADWLADRTRPASFGNALRLFDGILAGMDHAHRQGVIHRDLKPENVLLANTADGIVPRVSDFGMAKVFGQPGLSMTFRRFGTPEYMAPEQIASPSGVDVRADLWALGCILYELVTGSLAFEADDPRAAFERIERGSYVAPRKLRSDLPAPFAALISDLLQVDRDRRPASCREVRQRVRNIHGEISK
jgi:serine/threonine-protein kinase